MSGTGRKRQLPAKIQKMKTRKRQKLDQVANRARFKVDKSPNNAVSNFVKLDELQWNDVSIPEHMDDYGGFYGLEEVDGVEVIKDEDAAKITFKIAEPRKGAKRREKNSSKSPSLNISRDDVSQLATPGNTYPNDEWHGFEDTDATSLEPSESERFDASQLETVSPDRHRLSQYPRHQKVSEPLKDPLEEINGFSALENLKERESVDVSAWRALDLSSETFHALSQMGFSKPTEIQRLAIPRIREGQDLIGKAPTGSGKTLSFGIPIVEAWINDRGTTMDKDLRLAKRPCALIVLPTRELAHQIRDHLQALIGFAELEDLRVAAITGGLSIHKQRRLLQNADIIIGTPGRLWEIITEGHGVLESLKSIKFLIIDEADRLLSEGHFKELEEILNSLDKEATDETGLDTAAISTRPSRKSEHVRQTLIFSATFSHSLQQNLSKRGGFRPSNIVQDKSQTMEYLLRKLNFRSNNPAFIDVNPVQQMAENLREGFVECPAGLEKDLYLYTLLLYHHPGARALVFVNSISAVKRLVPLLNNLGLSAHPLQSHMPQKARLRSVERFSSPHSKGDPKETTKNLEFNKSETKILVATDVAARGLDIPHINLVLHYHVPRTADTYVHRSGRTARASNAGSSILICAPDEVPGVRRLVAQVHAQVASSSRGGLGTDRYHHQSKFYMQALAPDPRLVSKLKPRVALAKKIADSVVVKDKKRKEDDFFRAAAEELGVSSASEGFPSDEDSPRSNRKTKGARSSKQEQKGKGAKKRIESLNVTHDEMKAMRAELKRLITTKINLGVSEKYFVSQGGEKVEQLLREREKGLAHGDGIKINDLGVLGSVNGLGWDT